MSYSIGMLITNRLYKEGKYTFKEAAIIATGFLTFSATFMIVVAKTLGLMDLWSAFLLGFFSDHVPCHCHYRTYLANK
jgi:nucleoside recognition membrane protein YjiH